MAEIRRPDDMVRITTPELAQAFIDEQIALVKEQVGAKKVLLALPGAKIIDLDDHSRVAESWTQLRNPRVYYDFFKKHAAEFEDQ